MREVCESERSVCESVWEGVCVKECVCECENENVCR